MSKLVSAYFSSNGTWTCPAGVTRIMVIGQGGGAGGSGGINIPSSSSLGGGGTSLVIRWITVVPNTTYTITIGTGGAGGVPRTGGTHNGFVGGGTTFGSLMTFAGGLKTISSGEVPTNGYAGLICSHPSKSIDTSQAVYTSGYETVSTLTSGGTSSGTYWRGLPGLPGDTGSVAGTGGNGNNAGTGTNGGNATGIGAGGGGGGAGSVAGGSGGSGAPGQLYVVWVE